TIALASLVTNCAAPTVSYIDANSVNNLTSGFTMGDLLTVSQSMATSLIATGKINKCTTYTVSQVANKTDQYIDTSNITQSIQDKLSNSSAVTANYVISSAEMQNQVDELQRQNQSGLYDKSTTAKTGNMSGAECRIDGFINSITSVSADGKSQRIDYQFNMKLVNVKKGMGLWSQQKMISKQVQ
ncbi:MAG: penicillin-binding protein activator LpoB, partial [Burkholderiales bacterium]|nr:penicillin-binding protein activator LpoB [Burkholderiales bacterium]